MSERELEAYTLVVLRRGPRAGEYAGDELARLQEQHLAHLDELRRSGVLAVAGPFGDQPDETWRGLCVYRGGLDEARAHAERDPSVRAGRLAVDVLTWWVPRGELRVGS